MLSIIIPTYNSERTIEIAIRSVLAQLYSDWELLIIDGGSSDSTVSIANSFYDDRIIVISEPDNGVYDAMNKGIDLAHGEWLYFLGSDDYLINNHVLECLFLNETKADILYGDVESSHLDKRYSGEWTVPYIAFNRCHQCIFYKRWLFLKYGKYDLKYTILADRAFNLKVFFNNKVKAVYYPIIVAHFSSGGISSLAIDDAFYQDFSGLVLDNLYWKLHDSQKVYFIKDYLFRGDNNIKKILRANLLSIIRLKIFIKSKIKQFIRK